MSENPKDRPKRDQSPPDGRGPRPDDPNELAAWIVRQTTRENGGDREAEPKPPEQD